MMRAHSARRLAWSAGWLLAAAVVSAGDLRLVDAVRSGNAGAARALLKSGADVNSRQGDGATALHWAAHRNDAAMVDLLLGAGANANAANDLGVTPLALASEADTPAVVERLLHAGAEPDRADETGVTPLMIAARSGRVDIVRALLARRARVNAAEATHGQTALMWAVAQRHPQVVRALLEHGADIQARARVVETMVVFEGSEADGVKPAREVGTLITLGGSTPLLFAATHGDAESAALLLDAGANANDAAPDGHAAVVVAAHNGHAAVLATLLDHGADANAAAGGYTALHAAVLRSDGAAVRSLLAHGANPNARITRGTPLRRYGVEWALPGKLTGATPFFVAAAFADAAMMRVLLDAGADPALPIADGTAPLLAAAGAMRLNRPPVSPSDVVRTDSYGRMERADADDRAAGAVELLLHGGADVNVKGPSGDTALHVAASSGYARLVRLLTERRADVNARNAAGKTALDLALARTGQERFDQIAAVLRQAGATTGGTP